METIECRSAEKFINVLLPHNPKWKQVMKQFVFRGQGGSYPEILPSAHRPSTALIEKYREHKNSNTFREQYEIEFDILHDFIKLNNRIGLQVPNFYDLKQESDFSDFIDLRNRIGRGEINWPTKDYFPLVALAQHHGLPTSFIDWSYNSLKAAFFSTLADTNENETINVFALDAQAVHYYDRERDGTFRNKNISRQYRVFDSHFHENAYIQAQEGLFLACIAFDTAKNDDFKPLGLVEYCETNKISLLKVSTSAKNARKVQTILDRYGINFSTIFPDRNGIVKHMKTHFRVPKFVF